MNKKEKLIEAFEAGMDFKSAKKKARCSLRYAEMTFSDWQKNKSNISNTKNKKAGQKPQVSKPPSSSLPEKPKKESSDIEGKISTSEQTSKISEQKTIDLSHLTFATREPLKQEETTTEKTKDQESENQQEEPQKTEEKQENEAEPTGEIENLMAAGSVENLRDTIGNTSVRIQTRLNLAVGCPLSEEEQGDIRYIDAVIIERFVKDATLADEMFFGMALLIYGSIYGPRIPKYLEVAKEFSEKQKEKKETKKQKKEEKEDGSVKAN